MEKISKEEFTSISSNPKNTTKGKAIDAKIDPNETYLLTKNTITNTTIETRAANGFNPINNPNNVATPFPPLKPV